MILDFTKNSVSLESDVLLSILDHFTHRASGQTIVIGALISSKTATYTNVFPLVLNPLTKQVDLEHFTNMSTAFKNINPKESVVGWYATAVSVSNEIHAIQQSFGNNRMPNLLLVDAALSTGKLMIQGFSVRPLRAVDSVLGMMFLPVNVSTIFSELDASLSLSQQDEFSPKAGVDDISNLDQTISRTISKLKLVKTYIENVIKGSEKPDEKIGQFISDTLYSIPRPELGELKILVLKERNQIGLSKYLSELARAQMSISDKIAQI